MMRKQLVNLVIVALICIAQWHLAFAQVSNGDPFFVMGVKTYAEADTLEHAKSEATNTAVTEAYEVVIHRIMPSTGIWKLENNKQEESLVSVEQIDPTWERMTSDSYMATLNIKFNQANIRKLLNKMGAIYASEYDSATLIIPILKTGKQIIFNSSEWYDAWMAAPTELGLSKFSYPMYDLFDIRVINPDKIMTQNFNDLKSVIKKYNCTKAVIVFVNEENAGFNIAVKLVSEVGDSVNKLRVKKEQDTSPFKSLINSVLTALDDAYKSADPYVHQGYKTFLYCETSSNKEIVKKLSEVPEIEYLDISEQGVNLHYSITPEMMSDILKQRGLHILQKADKQFIVIKSDKK